MRKLSIIFGLTVLFLLNICSVSDSQVTSGRKLAVFVDGGYTQPLSRMAERFKGTYNIDGGLLYTLSDRLSAEFRFTYGKFNKVSDNPFKYTITLQNVVTTFAMPPGMEHYYTFGGFTPSLILFPVMTEKVKPYIIIGTGLYRINWYRGPSRSWTQTNRTGAFGYYINPTTKQMQDPYQAKRVTDWAWGFNGGVGILFQAGANMDIDIKGRWEGMLYELWPALFLGMEGARPVQMFNITAGIRFKF